MRGLSVAYKNEGFSHSKYNIKSEMVFHLPTSVSFLLALALGMSSGQDSTDCSALDVDREDSSVTSGANLGVCGTSESQCCTQDYLEEVREDVGEALLEGLRNQLEDRVEVVEELVERLGSYFEDDLISSIQENIPLIDLYWSDAPVIIAALANLLSREKFNINSTSPEVNTAQYVVDILMGIKMLIQRSSNFSDDQKMCLLNEMDSNLNQTAVDLLGASLKQVRRANSALIRILNFLEKFKNNLGGFDVSDFPRGCIVRAINIGFCGRCRALLPPLCSNTCGSLVRGCYAAFFSGLRREFNSLWKVIRQIIIIIEVGVKNIEESENTLLDDTELSSIVMQCGVAQESQKRSKADFIKPPSALTTRANGLRNVFAYGRSGPAFCEVESSERDFCQRGGGRGLSERSCRSHKLCTSSCQCWNGSKISKDDTPAFDGDEITDQENNQVFQATPEEYVATATKLGTPINSFLMSGDFTEVLPQNLLLPEPMPYDAGQGHVIISMATLMGAMVFVFVL